MASFHVHADSDNHPAAMKTDGVQRAIVAGLEEEIAMVSWGDKTETSVGRRSEGEGSMMRHNESEDTSTGTFLTLCF